MTEEMFMRLTKEQTWELFKGLQEFVAKFDEIQEKLEHIPILEARVTALEASLAVSQNTSSLLKTELIKEKKSNLQRSQYGRLENVEISGIPASIKDDDLEQTVVSIAEKIGVKIKKRDIAACHRLRGERKDTIVRFPNRKFVDSLFANAAQLKGKDLSETLGANHPPVYINSSLTPELKRMRWVAKRMKIAGLVERYGTNRRGVYVQAAAEGERYHIFVDSDLDGFLDGVSLHTVLYGEESAEVNEV